MIRHCESITVHPAAWSSFALAHANASSGCALLMLLLVPAPSDTRTKLGVLFAQG